MEWEPRTHLPIVAVVGLLVAAVALVTPWWTLEGAAGGAAGQLSASPFDPGGLEDAVSETGVVVVGVLAVVGILGAVGGLVLWIQNRQARDGSELEPAAWLWFVAGGFLLVAPLTAVLTWPADGLSFWSSAGGGNISVGTGAGAGWYLSLVAGAMLGVAGLAWLVRTEPGDEGADPEATATTGAPEAND